jgi:hypothetical protein
MDEVVSDSDNYGGFLIADGVVGNKNGERSSINKTIRTLKKGGGINHISP